MKRQRQCSVKLLFCRYADAYDVQVVDQSNCWRVPVQVSGCGGTPAEMVQMGWLFPMQQNHVLAGKVSAGCSYAICNRMADRCLAVRKTLIKAIELGFCRLVSISSTGVEDLFLGKKVPWQLLVLIEDEIGECYWRINVVHGRVTAEDMVYKWFCYNIEGSIPLSLSLCGKCTTIFNCILVRNWGQRTTFITSCVASPFHFLRSTTQQPK